MSRGDLAGYYFKENTMDTHSDSSLTESLSTQLDAMGSEGRVKLCFKAMWQDITQRVYSWEFTDDGMGAMFALRVLLDHLNYDTRTSSATFSKARDVFTEADWVKALIRLRDYGLIERVDSDSDSLQSPSYSLKGFFMRTGYSSTLSPRQIALLESLEWAHHPFLRPGDRNILNSLIRDCDELTKLHGNWEKGLVAFDLDSLLLRRWVTSAKWRDTEKRLEEIGFISPDRRANQKGPPIYSIEGLMTWLIDIPSHLEWQARAEESGRGWLG